MDKAKTQAGPSIRQNCNERVGYMKTSDTRIGSSPGGIGGRAEAEDQGNG